MMEKRAGGYIKLHRVLRKKAVWRTSNSDQKVILITLLLMVNWEESEWEWKGEKFTCKPGQIITSLDEIAKACESSISKQNVRTALKRFEKYEFLTDKSTNRNRLITICNWEDYQAEKNEPNRQPNRQLTGNQQAANRQLTPNEEYKEYKEEKEYTDNVLVLDEKKIVEDQKLKPKTSINFIDQLIEIFGQKYFEKFEIIYVPTAGDSKHMKWILSQVQKFKKQHGEKFNTDDTLAYFDKYFSEVVKIKDPFIQKNLTIAIIKNQFNQINRILKQQTNGQNTTNPNNLSNEELINAIKSGAQAAGYQEQGS